MADDDDPAVRLHQRRAGGVEAAVAERPRPVSAERRVEGLVCGARGVEARDGHVLATGLAGDDDLAVGLQRRREAVVGAAEVGPGCPVAVEARVEGAVRVQSRDREVVVAGARDDDLPVRLHQDRVGDVEAAVAEDLLAGAVGPARVEARVERSVGVEARDRDVEVHVRVAGDDDLAVGLQRRRIGGVEAAEVGAGHSAVEARVGGAVRVQSRDCEVVAPVAGKHELAVRLNQNRPGAVTCQGAEGPHAVAVEGRVEIARRRVREPGQRREQDGCRHDRGRDDAGHGHGAHHPAGAGDGGMGRDPYSFASVRHQADDPGARRREHVQGVAAPRACDAPVLDVRRDHDAVAGVHDPRLSADGELQLAGEDDRDLLLGVVVRRGDRVGLEPHEVGHHRVGGHGPELEARDHDQRVEVVDADEPGRRVRRLTGLVEVRLIDHGA